MPNFHSYCLKAVRHAGFFWNAKILPDLPKHRNPNSHTHMKKGKKKKKKTSSAELKLGKMAWYLFM